MANIQNAMLDLIAYLKGYAVVPDQNLQDLIDIISEKIGILEELMDKLDQIVGDLNTTTGIFVMYMPGGPGGNTKLKQYLRDCPLERSANQYTVMALFVSGGATSEPANTFRKLIV